MDATDEELPVNSAERNDEEEEMKLLEKTLLKGTRDMIGLEDDDEDMLDEAASSSRKIKTPKEALQYWNSHLETGLLSCHHFREWWRRWVPRLLSPTPAMNYQEPNSHLDEEKINDYLISPLEQFLTGSDDPPSVMSNLAMLNDPPAQCGKLFKMGDPTYSCKDCGHDPTCVLCFDCFKHSGHKSCRYKMSMSMGGGYCDCGDPEAWSNHVYCDKHMKGSQASTCEQNPLDKIPVDIQVRARHVLESVMRYAEELLTTEGVLNLPPDLTFKPDLDQAGFETEEEETYCAVIFNDEVHTFEEVITTLPRAVDCDRATAIFFATLVDKDGRAVIKCSGFQSCNDAKRIIERITSRRNTKALQVKIMNAHLYAHQLFAMRLLNWIQSFLLGSVGFRALFSETMMGRDVKSNSSLVESLCRKDTVLWKAARSLMHHLFISGMMLEQENKKRFACEFTRCYGQMMKDYVRDDHDHSFSITSLSVQLFTVPTLAHHLVAQRDILATLLRTLMSELEVRKNERGRLEFSRNVGNQSFRRSYYILHDLKYLLTTHPESDQWNDDMRKNFLHGVSKVIDIMLWMQGMDEQVRQTTHHIEYELEWESAFHLHIRMAPVTSLICEWACSDRVAFIKVVRMLLKTLYKDRQRERDNEARVTHVLADHEAMCVDYQVATKPVSFHSPLSRMLAGLSLSLGKYGLSITNANEFDFADKPSMIELMEPALRTTVLAAQVQAGMWRRNGYSLQDQVRVVYHQPRYRKELFDQDVIMLQLAAAHLDPDSFLINVLNKFGLVGWANKAFDLSEDDSIRQVTTLVEEFLSCVMVVLTERFTPGIGQVTSEEVLSKEIIQLLCVEPMTHSALNRALSENNNHDTGMEKVIRNVAGFKGSDASSTGTQKKYYLKEEFYNQYNVFFYHYSKEDQSKSEESMLARRKEKNEPLCNPPPPAPPLTQEFSKILKIMDCDVFLHIISLVLKRADNLKTRCFSENQVHRVLHLIGACLNEEERQRKDNREAMEDEECSHQIRFTERAKQTDIPDLLEQLVGNARIQSHKDLLAWTIKKFKQVSSGDSASDDSMATDDQQETSRADEERERKKRAALARREKLMAQMKSAQQDFLQKNEALSAETNNSVSSSKRRNESFCSNPDVEMTDKSVIALGPNKSMPASFDEESLVHTCILCQEEQKLTADGDALVMASFVQKSTVLNRNRKLGERFTLPGVKNIVERCPPYEQCPLLLADMPQSVFIVSCGHVMHATCYRKYFEDIVKHERQRSRMRHPHSFDVEQKEYLCPLCRCLSNSVIPLIPPFYALQPEPSKPIDITFSKWLQAKTIAVKYKREISEETEEEDNETIVEAVHALVPPAVQDPGAPSVAAAQDDAVVIDPRAAPEPQPAPGVVLMAEAEAGGGAGDDQEQTGEGVPFGNAKSTRPMALKSGNPRKRLYTCPLGQVVQELNDGSKESTQAMVEYSRLYTDHEGTEPQFAESVFGMMNAFCQSVCEAGLLPLEDAHDERIPHTIWQGCAYSIHSVAVSLYESGKTVLDPMSSRQRDCISGLVRICGVVGANFRQPKVIRSHAMKLLSTLLEVDTGNLSILEVDAFGLLVALTFSVPSMVNGNLSAPLPTANVQDQHLLRLLFLVHLVQIILTTDQFKFHPDEMTENDDECGPILDLLNFVRGEVGFSSESDGSEALKASGVWQDIKVVALPFLRSCSLLYHHLSDVSLPTKPDLMSPEEEFSLLTKYLGLPDNPKDLLQPSDKVFSLAKMWANHPCVLIALSTASKMPFVTYPLVPPSMIDLPTDYSELINMVSVFSCPKSSAEESRVPAMCLICGEILCSQSYCCQTTIDGESVGACTEHAYRCGSGNGIFIRVRECKVILMSCRKKGCFYPSPYLDQYGEHDDGLRRGNPLTLCPERLKKLQRMWLSHSIPEVIARTVETNMYYTTTPWQQL